MKHVKRLARFLHIQYLVTRKGVAIGIMLLRLLSRFRFKNPFRWLKKTRVEEPIIIKQADHFEHQVKSFFEDINIAQFTGDRVAQQIGSLVGKGIKLGKEFSNTNHQSYTVYDQEEFQPHSSTTQWSDFINEVDELLLHVERLEAHVNQLMSCDESN